MICEVFHDYLIKTTKFIKNIRKINDKFTDTDELGYYNNCLAQIGKVLISFPQNHSENIYISQLI